ncbi:hypothetical protein [Luteolibacter sp. LG18]|uniref:hypothetical protein n=1 Tax=Luteolibacter sp. LG18 TaxID=2819286 RepID=UPI002B312EC7|nr:hypothetical protein llg_12290 [Luteolibacter sp. LG18]
MEPSLERIAQPPRIPRGRLWLCLLAPPVGIVAWMALALVCPMNGHFLEWSSALVLAVAAASLVGFVRLLKPRFLMRNVVLFTLAYLVAQCVIGAILVAAWFYLSMFILLEDISGGPGDFVS